MSYVEGLQVITTKSIGATARLGARIKARAEAGSITLSREHDDTEYNQHKRVATALCEKFDWKYNHLVGGQTHTGEYVWLMLTLR